MTTRIVTIDDHPLFRKGLAQLIALDNTLTLVGEAANGKEGVILVKDNPPDIVLLDLNMPGQDGIETLRQIKELDLDTRVIMLTVSDGEDDLVAALRAGADGYLLKDMEPEQTLDLIRQAAADEMVISPRLTARLAKALQAEHSVPSNTDQAGLTEREHEILQHIAKGDSNKLIAKKLEIVESTVKVHVKHILKKLNLRSRVEAAVWATHNLK